MPAVSSIFPVSFTTHLSHKSPLHMGIDIGIGRVNTATLGSQPRNSAGRSNGTCRWLSKSEFEIPIDPRQPPPPDWLDIVTATLVDRLPRCVDGQRVVASIALPLPWIHYQTASPAEREIIQSQCDQMFGDSIFRSDAHLSAWPACSEHGKTMIAATARRSAKHVADAVASIGFDVHSILPHGVALLEAAPALTSLTPPVVVLLEFSGGLLAFRGPTGCGLCRILPACEIPVEETTGSEQIAPWLGEIADEILASENFWSRIGGTCDAESPLLLCGGAARVPGVDALLASMLARPVACWQYAGRTRPQTSRCDNESADSELAMSLSLACCSSQPHDRRRRH